MPATLATVLVVLLGLVLEYFKHLSYCRTIPFGLAIIVFVMSLLYTIYYLVRSYYGYEYAVLSGPKQISDFYDELERYCAQRGESAMAEFDEYMLNFYVEAGEINTLNSRRKGEYLHLAVCGIIAAMTSGGVAWVLLLINKWTA
jgi:hypothetical protein